MKKKILKLALFLLVVAFVFVIPSCDKEEVQTEEPASGVLPDQSAAVMSHGSFSGTPLIEFRRGKSLSKTYLFGKLEKPKYDTMFSTAKEFPFNSSARKYKVMKVWRHSDPGKFFWIMLENFKYKPGDSSYVYDNKESNAAFYGRMYHWSIAKQCERKVGMFVQKRLSDGTYTDEDDLSFTYGRLPTVQDIEDLMEVTTPPVFGSYYETGPTLFDVAALDDGSYVGYYDAFISGRENYGWDYNDSTYYHTLAGWLDNTDLYWLTHRSYQDIHEQVCFWLNDSSIPNAHYPFEIRYQDGAFVASIPAHALDHYGYCVRYVFDPK